MFLSVVIASKGRPEVLAGTIRSLEGQVRQADEIIVVVTSEQDYNKRILTVPTLKVFVSPPGLPVQRNIGIDETNEYSDLVVFLDDDVELARNYLLRIESLFLCMPQAVAASGTPLMDIPEDGLMSRQTAIDHLSNSERPTKRIVVRSDLYGCNMVIRRKILDKERFDENLIGYAYLEDKDIGLRISKYGEIYNFGGDSIIHLGVNNGRISEARLGYAQMMNPLYLFFIKRVLTLGDFLYLFVQVFVGNLLGAAGIMRLFRKNDKLDKSRRERVKGNLAAFNYIFVKGINPQSVKEYSPIKEDMR